MPRSPFPTRKAARNLSPGRNTNFTTTDSEKAARKMSPGRNTSFTTTHSEKAARNMSPGRNASFTTTDSESEDDLHSSFLSSNNSYDDNSSCPRDTSTSLNERSPKITPRKNDGLGSNLQRRSLSRNSPHQSSQKEKPRDISASPPSTYTTKSLYPSLSNLHETKALYPDLPNIAPQHMLTPQKKSPGTSDSNSWIPWIAGCVFLIVILYIIYPQEPTQVKPQSEFDIFVDGMNKLKAKFHAQDSRMWQITNAAIKRIINDEVPIQPAVILLASVQSTRREVDCLARHISQVVKEAYKAPDPIFIDIPKEYVRLPPGVAKIAMDNTLRSGFNNGSKSAVISGLQELNGNTAMLLHAFCDNDDAPFTKVVILLTVHVDGPEITDIRESVKMIERSLQDIWLRHANIDDVSALLNRVAHSIAIVKEEPSDVMAEHC